MEGRQAGHQLGSKEKREVVENASRQASEVPTAGRSELGPPVHAAAQEEEQEGGQQGCGARVPEARMLWQRENSQARLFTTNLVGKV